MGYQESWFYIEPQHKFKKLIQAYEKAEQSSYYEVAGAEPHSVIVLKQPFGDIPAGKKLLWVCGDRGFHCAAGVFGGELKCSGRLRVIPVEEVLDSTDDPRMEGAGLRQSGSQRKCLYETIQRCQLRPPDAGGAGEMKGGLP